ncbi:MAG: hypothetical protein QW840_03225, partial [Candidatus Bathyarchaeia archaeon]
AVGKVVKTEWDGKHLWYEAEIYDEEIAAKIKNELIKHVSIGADYETIDAADGKVPHNLHNAELSLVAVPGVPETNIQVLEKLRCEEQKAAPLIAGDYVLGFYQDVNSFLPQHFSIVWLDKENGILAIFGKTKASPETQRVQSLFFAKEKLWDENKIRDWLSLHPHYMVQAGGFEALLKDQKPMVAVEEVVRMIQNVLPNPVVEHSWGLGSQRLCQELRGIILKLKGELKYAD